MMNLATMVDEAKMGRVEDNVDKIVEPSTQPGRAKTRGILFRESRRQRSGSAAKTKVLIRALKV